MRALYAKHAIEEVFFSASRLMFARNLKLAQSTRAHKERQQKLDEAAEANDRPAAKEPPSSSTAILLPFCCTARKSKGPGAPVPAPVAAPAPAPAPAPVPAPAAPPVSAPKAAGASVPKPRKQKVTVRDVAALSHDELASALKEVGLGALAEPVWRSLGRVREGQATPEELDAVAPEVLLVIQVLEHRPTPS